MFGCNPNTMSPIIMDMDIITHARQVITSRHERDGTHADIVGTEVVRDNDTLVVVTTKGRGRATTYTVWEVVYTMDASWRENPGEGVIGCVATTCGDAPLDFETFKFPEELIPPVA